MATALEVAKFLFGAAGQSSPGKRAGTLAGGGNTTVRYGTVKTVDGTSVTILMEDTGETLYTMTTTPVAVGDRVAIIKNGQSVIVYATDQIVEMINKTVIDGDAEYAVGDDAYTAPENGWSTTMPDVGQGEYLWMRYTTTLQDGTVKTSTPVCLTSSGVKIDRVRDMYYLSTSETQVTGGTWVYDECPEWQEGHYIWTRMEITYDDGSVYLTDPVLMSALNQANENAAKVTWHVWPDDDGLHITQDKNSVGSTTNMLLSGDSIYFRLGDKTLMQQYLDEDNNVVFDVMGWGGFRFASSDATLNMTNTGFSYSAMYGGSFSSNNMHAVETAELELTGDQQYSTFSNVLIPNCTSLPDYMVIYYYDIFGYGHRSEKIPIPQSGTAQAMYLLGYGISSGNSAIVMICEGIEITVTGIYAPIYCSVTRGAAGPVRANIAKSVGINSQPGTQFYIEKINFCW